MGELLKVLRNKRNNQLIIMLSRKKLNLLKSKDDPEYIELTKANLRFKKKDIL